MRLQYVNLGRAGVEVSRICLGRMSFGNDAAWKLELNEASRIENLSHNAGANQFDTYAIQKLTRCFFCALADRRFFIVGKPSVKAID